MSEIKLKDIGVQKAKALQKSAVAELQEIYGTQKSVFGAMKSSWKGKSGDAFRQGSNELLSETLMAQLTLENLKRETSFAERTFKDADKTLKQAIEEK